jgi:3-oxoacyl-[acyl-carrier-protein] synthase-3
MAFFEFKDVRIAGISAGVPANIVYNDNTTVQSNNYNVEAYVESTGVRQRRISTTLTTSDLCYRAAEQLIADLRWDKSEIDILIFVSQNADYILPATACILQDRLGLSKECYAADIALGCSGWVYGLSTIVSLLSTGSVKKALLLTGDAKRRAEVFLNPLFGYAGTVTALEYVEGVKSIQFHFGTDGSGFEAIIIPDGGSRNPVSFKSFEKEDIDGQMRHRIETRMKGMDVFSFGISVPPKSIKKLAEHYGFDYLDADYYIFHQANMKMNEKIRTKLKLDAKKVPYCMPDFGNTSSASIPLTIVSELKGKVENKFTKFICCGFGVGLSWGTVAFETENIVLSDLVELE